ncbi:hypothetical protein BDV12DRAFT_202109 [Aspergillus spectabilis]
MSGSRLPTEIIAEVASNLDPDLVQDATVSLKLNTPERLAEFETSFARNAQRQLHLPKIDYILQLESYSIEARADFETAEEHERNNKIFVHSTQFLLESLASWPEDRAKLELSFKAQSPSDSLWIVKGREPPGGHWTWTSSTGGSRDPTYTFQEKT